MQHVQQVSKRFSTFFDSVFFLVRTRNGIFSFRLPKKRTSFLFFSLIYLKHRWFCNGRGSTSGSHIVNHLVRAKHKVSFESSSSLDLVHPYKKMHSTFDQDHSFANMQNCSMAAHCNTAMRSPKLSYYLIF